MKQHIFCLMLLIFAIIVKAQVVVKYNGYKQVESTVAIHPSSPNILATAVIELIPGGRQSIICISTNNGASWTQKKTVLNAADPVIEFDNQGNILFSLRLSRSHRDRK